MTTGRASARMRWNASSSASTPTGRIRALARTPASGLSISKQIIEAHNGRIWAENRHGPADADGKPTVAGARFVVRLPAP